jgi:F-type H+-transporting ATPase subunit alpha
VRRYEVSELQRYEKEMLDYVRQSHRGVLDAIRTTGKLEEDTEQKLVAALDAFGKIFQPTKAAGSEA